MTDNDRARALELALGQIEKQFGRGAVMKLGDAESKMSVEVISTGSLGLDIAPALGASPWARDRDLPGIRREGTLAAMHVMAEAQRKGGTAAYIDVEHAYRPGYARDIGIASRTCSYRSRTLGNKRSRSARPWCDRTLSTSSSSIAWRPSCRGPRSRARWARARGRSAAHVQAPRKLTATIAHEHGSHLHQPASGRWVSSSATQVTHGRAQVLLSVRIEIRPVEQIKRTPTLSAAA
jgi:recombination protein RecA